jgi:hypothetical protein
MVLGFEQSPACGSVVARKHRLRNNFIFDPFCFPSAADVPEQPKPVTPQDIKKQLVAAGIEVYRTQSNHVVLAERVRENLILDAMLRVYPDGATRQVREDGAMFLLEVVFRVEGHVFRGEREDQLFARVHALAQPASARGFREHARQVVPITDPSSPGTVLDHFYELSMRADGLALNRTVDEVRYFLGIRRAIGDESGDA